MKMRDMMTKIITRFAIIDGAWRENILNSPFCSFEKSSSPPLFATLVVQTSTLFVLHILWCEWEVFWEVFRCVRSRLDWSPSGLTCFWSGCWGRRRACCCLCILRPARSYHFEDSLRVSENQASSEECHCMK